MRKKICTEHVIFSALLCIAHLWGQQALARDSLRDLLITYRCEVVRRLERIYAAGDPTSDRDRFIAITVPGRAQAYVQCLLHDKNTGIYCEAASGFWFDEPGKPRTFYHPRDAIAALARLGFNTDDSAENFSVDRDLATPPDFNALADFILRTLHDGYGARDTMRLEFNAPFAPDKPTSCIPLG